jgi:hypothetical protein
MRVGKQAFERSKNMIDDKSAEELIESVFNFDYVGDAMMEARRNLDSLELQQRLINETVAAAVTSEGDNSAEAVAVLTKAAEARVKRYIDGSRAAKGSGCGG